MIILEITSRESSKLASLICNGIKQNTVLRSANPLDFQIRWGCLHGLSSAPQYFSVPPGFWTAVNEGSGFLQFRKKMLNTLATHSSLKPRSNRRACNSDVSTTLFLVLSAGADRESVPAQNVLFFSFAFYSREKEVKQTSDWTFFFFCSWNYASKALKRVRGGTLCEEWFGRRYRQWFRGTRCTLRYLPPTPRPWWDFFAEHPTLKEWFNGAAPSNILSHTFPQAVCTFVCMCVCVCSCVSSQYVVQQLALCS